MKLVLLDSDVLLNTNAGQEVLPRLCLSIREVESEEFDLLVVVRDVEGVITISALALKKRWQTSKKIEKLPMEPLLED